MEDQSMNDTVKIALLHLTILSTQAFYMYLSNKTQLKRYRYLYVAALVPVLAVPTILNFQDPHAYCLYEYATIICIFTAAVADVIIAAGYNKEYMTDDAFYRFCYSYFLICVAAAFSGGISISIRIITAMTVAVLLVLFTFFKKQPVQTFAKGIPLAAFSVVCSWALLPLIL